MTKKLLLLLISVEFVFSYMPNDFCPSRVGTCDCDISDKYIVYNYFEMTWFQAFLFCNSLGMKLLNYKYPSMKLSKHLAKRGRAESKYWMTKRHGELQEKCSVLDNKLKSSTVKCNSKANVVCSL